MESRFTCSNLRHFAWVRGEVVARGGEAAGEAIGVDGTIGAGMVAAVEETIGAELEEGRGAVATAGEGSVTSEGAVTEAAGGGACTAGVMGVEVAGGGSTVRGEGRARAWAGMLEGGVPLSSSAPVARGCMGRGGGGS